MNQIVTRAPPNIEAELGSLAVRYRAASHNGIEVLNLIGAQADNLLDRLPPKVRSGLGDATAAALTHAMTAAHSSRQVVGDQNAWVNTAVSSVLGAAGGVGGLPTALAELPVTTTLLLRAIQGVAVEHGFDASEENVQFDCIQVFSSAGPLAGDDGADIAFLSTRMMVTGATLQGLIARIAPRLAIVLGQKLAAQAVPILGAVAGAATNYAYTRYYQEIAHVHFGLRKLAIDADRPLAELTAELARLMEAPLPRA